jgi:putative ABC transport system substrate-binding protein
LTYRSSAGLDEQLPTLASELAALNVDIIVAYGSVATEAAQKATRIVPVVMVSAFDPVQAGFVTSVSTPGGNITGSSDLSEQLIAKRLELLNQLIRPAGLIAVLWDTTNPATAMEVKRTEAIALALSLRARYRCAESRRDR